MTVGQQEIIAKRGHQPPAIFQRKGDDYVAPCPELYAANQGNTVEVAKRTVVEALELFFEGADASEDQDRLNAKCA